MIPSQHVEIIHTLVHQHLNGEVQQITEKTLGFSGSDIYLVDVVRVGEQLRCIAKFTPAGHALDDSVTNRVYGSNVSSFDAVYALLQQHHIPLPQLYASYGPQADFPFYCHLMECLPGTDINSTLKSTPPSKQQALQQCLGQGLGAIHSITRGYDGLVDQPTPYSLSWRDAFFTAIQEPLAAVRTHPLLTAHHAAIERTVTHFESLWSDPTSLVLSHGDGLQGMVVENVLGWHLSGIFDIEDHKFTDQRFVLSVFELELEVYGSALLPSFWSGYKTQKAVDPTYRQMQPLFQLYVLLDWIVGISPGELTERLSRMVTARCQVEHN